MKNTEVLFLGTTACIFDKEDDATSFLVNKKYLFDTGWSLVGNLIQNEIDPLTVRYLFFSHMHHDHYISLPQMLFYYLQCGGRLEELNIIGPAKDVKRIVDYAMQFIEADVFWNTGGPQITRLDENDAVETEDMLVETCRSIHSVEGLCYRITDKLTDKVICYTGDTSYNEMLERHFKKCDLLIHEVSLGMCEKKCKSEAESGHSTVQEAIALANSVGAKQIFMVHNSKIQSEEFLEYAKCHFEGEIARWPEKGKKYEI